MNQGWPATPGGSAARAWLDRFTPPVGNPPVGQPPVAVVPLGPPRAAAPPRGLGDDRRTSAPRDWGACSRAVLTASVVVVRLDAERFALLHPEVTLAMPTGPVSAPWPRV